MNTLSRRKKIFFQLFLISAFFLILILLEVTFRIAFPSLANPIVKEENFDSIEWYRINRSYLHKYFPANSILIPEFKPALFKKDKGKVFRIFCLGGSTMFGTPYEMTANIPGILRKQLRHLYPEREIEVINLGASAINSHVIRDLAEEILRFEPDLIVLYMGHNEFYGPEGVGASFLEKKIPALIPLKYRLRELRTVQFFRKFLGGKSKKLPGEDERNLMKEVSRSQWVALYSPEAERVFSRFERNLGAILEIFYSRDIPVLLSDVASNLAFPPFVSNTLAPMDQKLFQQAQIDYQDGHYHEALNSLLKIRAADSTHAGVNFRIAQIYRMLNNTRQARMYFEKARDFDLLKFRAPERINRIIAAVSRKYAAPFISSDSLISALSPSGITGFEYFWEHLHPNFAGYYEISNLFLERMMSSRLLPEERSASFSDRLPLHPDSLSVCWLDLAYADLSIQNLTGKWPFQNFQASLEFFPDAPEPMQQIARNVYRRKRVWDEGCYLTAEYFIKTANFRSAQTTYEALLEEYPYNFYTHYLMANLFKNTGRLEKAVRHYQTSVKSRPDYPYSRLELGLVQVNLGQFDDAIQNLNIAVNLFRGPEMTSAKASAYYGLSAAFANKNDFESALINLDRSLQIMPDYEAARILKKQILQYTEN